MIQRVFVGVIVVALLSAALWWSQIQREPLKVSGFVEAHEIRLGSRVGGRVAKVFVEEGDDVAPGQVLVELEPYDLAERLTQAQSELATREAELAKLMAGYRVEERAQAQSRLDQWTARLDRLVTGPRKQEIAAAQARERLAEAELIQADQDNARTSALFQRNAVNREDLDKAGTRLKVAQETLEVRKEELAQMTEGTREEDIREARAQRDEAEQALRMIENGFRAEDVDQARAAVESARAAVGVIQAQMRELTITNPVAGQVEAIDLEPGDLVGPNAPVISVVDNGSLWVRAYVPENRMSLSLGQNVRVTLDSFPGETFDARVTFIARQAEFMPGNLQTPEERSKQVFRIKATLASGLDRVRPGMIGDVWLDQAAKGASP